LTLLIVAAIAAAALVAWRGTASRDGEPPPETPPASAVRREVEPVVTATGVVKPRIGAEVRVGSRISGVVTRLFVRIGSRVEKGQLLAELDARELESRRAEAAAVVESSTAELRYAQADLERRRELHAAELLAANDLELASRAAAVAEQRLREAEAGLELATTQLGFTRIHAPIAGVVASISTQEGETVAASFAAPTFVTLLDLARLEVWAYVDETDIGRIEVGQQARFTVDTYPGQELEARVTAIHPQAEIRDNVVNYVTVLDFEPPAGRTLRPEMTAAVRIALAPSEPKEAS
jgi:RND family efflux transporter MFP subunit